VVGRGEGDLFEWRFGDRQGSAELAPLTWGSAVGATPFAGELEAQDSRVAVPMLLDPSAGRLNAWNGEQTIEWILPETSIPTGVQPFAAGGSVIALFDGSTGELLLIDLDSAELTVLNRTLRASLSMTTIDFARNGSTEVVFCGDGQLEVWSVQGEQDLLLSLPSQSRCLAGIVGDSESEHLVVYYPVLGLLLRAN